MAENWKAKFYALKNNSDKETNRLKEENDALSKVKLI